MDKVDYSQAVTPGRYRCGTCQVSGVKLWREYQTFSPGLLCARCAAEDQGKDISNIDAEGSHRGDMGRTDTIGWYVPAVPCEDGEGYWGYTSVPQAGVTWWRRLPTMAKTS
jgi:hypothetical protein